jgi:DNA-binding NarL/FixJ family response regulator
MIRTFVVDDHEMLRAGVCQLIDHTPGMMVVGESDTVSRTLSLVPATQPDVVIVDVNLPDGSGIELCRTLRSQYPDLHCLMFTGYTSEDAALAAMLAGASGFVLKTIHSNNLVESIRRVSRGETLVPNGHVAPPRESPDALWEHRDVQPQLTRRQRQVLSLIAEGMSNRQIGAQLGLTEKTVKNYVSGLLATLGMERRTQAAVYGVQHTT